MKRDDNGTCGVYFLFLKGVLQYIGQSIDFYKRVKYHKSQGLIYDQVKVKYCKPIQLPELEAFYIKKFHPPLNETHKEPKKKRRKAWPGRYAKPFNHMRLRKLTEKSTVGFSKWLYTVVSTLSPMTIAHIYFCNSHINFFDDVLDRAKISPEWRIQKPGSDRELYFKFSETVWPEQLKAYRVGMSKRRRDNSMMTLKAERNTNNNRLKMQRLNQGK